MRNTQIAFNIWLMILLGYYLTEMDTFVHFKKQDVEMIWSTEATICAREEKWWASYPPFTIKRDYFSLVLSLKNPRDITSPVLRCSDVIHVTVSSSAVPIRLIKYKTHDFHFIFFYFLCVFFVKSLQNFYMNTAFFAIDEQQRTPTP